MKFDMHCHTKAGSLDSKVTIEEYIDKLRSCGFAGMLVTDHDSYKGFHYYENNRRNMPDDFTVLMGVEYDTKDAGHFLVILPDGIELRVLQIRGMSLSLLIHIVHYFGGILGPAHPFGARSSSAMFFNKMRKNPHLVRQFDFLEGFNTCETTKANQIAQLLASKYGKPCFGGSDSHVPEYVGMAFTSFDEPITCNDDLIHAVTHGNVAAFGGTERAFLKKHKKRNWVLTSAAFKVYNRTLGFLFTPYRTAKVRKLHLHHR